MQNATASQPLQQRLLILGKRGLKIRAACEAEPRGTERKGRLIRLQCDILQQINTGLQDLAPVTIRPSLADKVLLLLNEEERIVAALEAAVDRGEREDLRRRQMVVLRKVCRMVNRRYGISLRVRAMVYFTKNEA